MAFFIQTIDDSQNDLLIKLLEKKLKSLREEKSIYNDILEELEEKKIDFINIHRRKNDILMYIGSITNCTPAKMYYHNMKNVLSDGKNNTFINCFVELINYFASLESDVSSEIASVEEKLISKKSRY